MSGPAALGEGLRAALLVAFVGLGVRVRLSSGGARRRRVDQLLAYVLVVSFGVGLCQWDAWPFTTYRLAAFLARDDRTICLTDFAGVDASGNDWRLDPYTFTPVYHSVLQYWIDAHLDGLAPPARDRALRFLLERAEASRARLARGEPIGYARRLGPAHARYWWLLPREQTVPAEPWVGLRLYRDCWVPRDRFAGRSRPVRTLRAEIFAAKRDEP